MESTEKILQQRQVTHGSWREGARVSQDLKKIFREGLSSRPDFINEALDRIAMKLSRILIGDPMETDHWQDIAGYSKLVVKELEAMYADSNL